MLKHLRIAGFKRFDAEGVDLDLRPITLLLGGNSTGKSSVFQALLCLIQSWERPTGLAELATTGNRVDLGRFARVLHRADGRCVDEILLEINGVTFTWEDADAPMEGAIAYFGTRHGSLRAIDVHLAGDYLMGEVGGRRELELRDRMIRLVLSEEILDGKIVLTLYKDTVSAWLIDHPEDAVALEPLLKAMQGTDELGTLSWEIADEGNTPLVPRCEPFADPRMQALFELISSNTEAEGTLWAATNAALRRVFTVRAQLRRVTHIGGLRERGTRIYTIKNADMPWRVGPSGQRISEVLLSVEGALARTNELLSAAGIPYNVVLRDVGGASDAIEILLSDMREGPTKGNEVGLPDVGSGVAQILPVAVQLAALASSQRIANDAVVLIEQPELHLHPAWQARLARMFSAAVDPRFGENRIQILVETHSEHLVLAMGNEIANPDNELHSDEVSLLVFEDRLDRGRTVVSRVHFDEDGQFLERWPGGFFPERRRLLEGGTP